MLSALVIHDDPWIALCIRPGVVPVERQALVAQLIASDVLEAPLRPALQQQDAFACFRQYSGRNSAARARPHDNHVVILYHADISRLTAEIENQKSRKPSGLTGLIEPDHRP